jgi:hypothetical protein
MIANQARDRKTRVEPEVKMCVIVEIVFNQTQKGVNKITKECGRKYQNKSGQSIPF